jgi:hypothetical protein
VNRSPIALRRLVPLVLVALVAGTIAAQADGGGSPAAKRGVAATAPPLVAPAPAAAVWAAVPECRPAKPSSGAGAPPSQALLNAFGILRRERRPEDALPAEALAALKRAGLAPVAAESARLLRTGPGGGRAWVVPVPDVTRAFGFPCFPGKFRPVPKVPKPAPVPKVSPAPKAPTPKTVPPAKPTVPDRRPADAKPREGLAVVALGDAAPGGGGALDDLVRGRAPVWVDQCAGKGRDMLGVSGIVPDGVAAAFLTAPDGTAVKADVKDNGYEFLIPRPRRFEQRFVVWTGGDGTPHVQPVLAAGVPRGIACRRLASLDKIPRITPAGPFAACPAAWPVAVPAPLRPPTKRDRARRLRLPAPIFVPGCAPGRPGALIEPAPAPPLAEPAPVPRKRR